MSSSIFILQGWKKQQQVFLKNLEILRLHNQTAATHDLRVATKKLRSYLKLLSILLRKGNDKLRFEKTEYLFSVLGKLRDIEVGLLLLETFEKKNKIGYAVVKDHLKVAGKQASSWVKAAVKSYDEKEICDLTAQIEDELKKKDADKITAALKTIIDKELEMIIKLANHLHRQAHRVRKLLKSFFYWVTLGPKDSLLDDDKIKGCKKVMEQLGDWQDHEMLLQKIKHFRKDFVPGAKEEYASLKALEKNIEKKMEAIIKDTAENIRTFLV